MSDWNNKTACSEIESFGFAIMPQVLDDDAIASLLDAIEKKLSSNLDPAESLKGQGVVVGGRNLLTMVPESLTCWRHAPVLDLLRELLGEEAGLVRGLYFDKPPERSWSLPWHKDRTIAVQQHRSPSPAFSKPTVKAGVPHVEASEFHLNRMITLRIHLDAMTNENGPLRVLPGSHLSKKGEIESEGAAKTISVSAGDIFVMRPLLTHCSIASQPGTRLHRRILHLEFSADRTLPDGYVWAHFEPVFSRERIAPHA